MGKLDSLTGEPPQGKMNTEQQAKRITISGIVQGVGFRPFIYSLATNLRLTGWVRNTSSGVEIEVNGSPLSLNEFITRIRADAPPLARIDRLESVSCPPNGSVNFEIIISQAQPGAFMPISPDMCTCPDCQRELFDPANRRFRYPFINCTNCGPRFTITTDIPYDRPNTTMSGFPMCADCAREYHDPADRRFHAQPVACPVCGPRVWFESGGERLASDEIAVQMARAWLSAGKIIAIKGLGGFHLACDASNPAAVKTLRERKKRSDKAFALMAFDLSTIEKHCTLLSEEKALLLSRQRPIILLNRNPASNIATQVAPGQDTLGIMLAYTPLHLLLLEPEPGYPELLVMTSGNLSEEPIAYRDDDAKTRLDNLADGYLLHDRPIHMRIDDSVTRVFHQKPYLLRRARGYAPDPIVLPRSVPPILAAGAELKNAFCLTRDHYAFLSHHIGDMENYETLCSFEEGIAHYEKLFRIQPAVITCDLHPDYLASRYARQRAQDAGLPLIEVQHHHAHLAACLADNGLDMVEPVIAFSFDGTGFGTDGAIWGSEVFYGGYTGFQRRFHLEYIPLPGGDLAVRQPGRAALAHLWQAGIDWEDDLPVVRSFCAADQAVIRSQITHRLNAPLTSSMGRFFDAAAALLGVRKTATYEGQPAIEFEALADPDETGAYDFAITDGIIDPATFWEALIADWRASVPIPRISARFHNGVARLVLQLSQQLRQETGCNLVALSGGVWQNQVLLDRSVRLLEDHQFRVLLHRQTPPNDGCIAFGQAMVAAYTLQNHS